MRKASDDSAEIRRKNPLKLLGPESGLYVFLLTISGYLAAYAFEAGYVGMFHVPATSVRLNVNAFVYAIMLILLWLGALGALFLLIDKLLKTKVLTELRKDTSRRESDFLMQFYHVLPVAIVVAMACLVALPIILTSRYHQLFRDFSPLYDLGVFAFSFLIALVFHRLSQKAKMMIVVAFFLVYAPLFSNSIGKFMAVRPQAYWTTTIDGKYYLLVKDYGDRLLLNRLDQHGRLTRDILYFQDHNITLTYHPAKGPLPRNL